MTQSAGPTRSESSGKPETLRPKIFVVNMFGLEAAVWKREPATDILNLSARRIQVPGLCPKYPEVFCTTNGEVCQVITGEGCECLPVCDHTLSLIMLTPSP